MPKVYYVKAARKDNPAVKKGQPYYHWAFYRGSTHYSATYPRQSQLTQNEHLSAAHLAAETLQDNTPINVTCASREELEAFVDEVKGFLEEADESVQECSQGFTEKADNIREHFSESEIADTAEEQAGEMDTWSSEIQDAITTIESIDLDTEDYDSAVSEIIDAYSGVSSCPI
uniref:Uncharacterized protein n=1 Tax=Pseudomonas phage Cygsa01 TaxID=3138529 RepID=A0AAU6W3H6_9VIRU